MSEELKELKEKIKTRFEESKRVLSFEDFLTLARANPYRHVRNAPAYILDAIESFGKSSRNHLKAEGSRYKIFDNAFSEHPQPLIGQEEVQERVVRILRSFKSAGKADKLVLLHGPNGSAKSSFVRTLFEGIEKYSQGEEGMSFSFSWIFPSDAYDRKTLGIGNQRGELAPDTDSYAHLETDQIGAIVRSELFENPLFLIPKQDRKALFEKWISQVSPAEKAQLEICKDHFIAAELGHKNALIFEALLNNYNGDLTKVLRHVRIERHFYSSRLRKSLVTIEPLLAVDAGMRQVTLDRSFANLPPALQSLNLFQLEGHLVDGNRGLVEFNDLLKRPLEHYKYLLSTTETGQLSLGSIVVNLDTVFIGSTNDRQLEAFREHPEFNSFKARIELVKVPYLLRFSDEQSIYQEVAERATRGKKELLPHTTRALALWAVAARLKKPLLKNKNSMLTKILENLNPIEKAYIYDSATLPEHLNDEQRRELKGHLDDLTQEHQRLPYYEGMLGPSARELKSLIQIAAQSDVFKTLSPNAIFSELRELVRRPQDLEYLRQEPVGLYHNYEALIEMVRKTWLDWVEDEMRSSLDLEREPQLKDFLGRYIYQCTHHVRGEKVKNRITGQSENPDETLMQEFEKMVGAHAKSADDDFRKNVISRLGAWSVDNPQSSRKSAELPYDQIFPDLMDRLRHHHKDTQTAQIRAMGALIMDIQDFESWAEQSNIQSEVSEPKKLALKAYKGLQERFGYGPSGAKEALLELIKDRFL